MKKVIITMNTIKHIISGILMFAMAGQVFAQCRESPSLKREPAPPSGIADTIAAPAAKAATGRICNNTGLAIFGCANDFNQAARLRGYVNYLAPMPYTHPPIYKQDESAIQTTSADDAPVAYDPSTRRPVNVAGSPTSSELQTVDINY